MATKQEYEPPSIQHLKAFGVSNVRLFCDAHACSHKATIGFEALNRSDQTVFSELRFRCSKCGSRSVSVQPEWPSHGVLYQVTVS